MKKSVIFLLFALIFISACSEDDLLSKETSEIYKSNYLAGENIGANIQAETHLTCADINHPNCVEINSCGEYIYSRSSPQTYLLLTQNVSSPMSCFFLGGNVTLDLNGFTVKFADGDYQSLSNGEFEDWSWNGAKWIPDNWDTSLAPGLQKKETSTDMPLVNGSLIWVPAGETLISDWIYLPIADRTYRAMVASVESSSSTGYVNLYVENQNNEIVCQVRFPPMQFRAGTVPYCNFNGQPAGYYRLKISPEDDHYFDNANIIPAHDIGVAALRVYYTSYCDWESWVDATSGCIAPDYYGEVPVVVSAYINIQNGNIESVSPNYMGAVVRATSMLYSDSALNIYNVNMKTSGIISYLIKSGIPGEISYSTFSNYQAYALNRHNSDEMPVNLAGGTDFHHNYVYGGQGQITPRGPNVLIHDNILRNRQTVTNRYTIMSTDYTSIYNNIFDPVQGSGINLYSTNDAEIYGNTFYLSTTPCDPEYVNSDFSTSGIRINDYGGSENTYNNQVYDNTFYITGEDVVLYPNCKPITAGIFYSASGANNHVYNNSFYVEKTYHNDVDPVVAFYIGSTVSTEVTYNNPPDNPLFVNNNIEANDYGIWLGTYYGGALDIWFENTTFVGNANTYYTPTLPGSAIRLGAGSSDVRNLRLINSKFSGVFDPDTYLFTSSSSSGLYSLFKKNSLHIYVSDSNGNPISGATVLADGVDDYSGTTDPDGYVELLVTQYEESGDMRSSGVHNRNYLAPYDVYVNGEYYTTTDANIEQEINIVIGGEITCPNNECVNENCHTCPADCDACLSCVNNQQITDWCSCNGVDYNTGYCCDGVYQTTECVIQQCTDSDQDGYYAEDNCGTTPDCRDNNEFIHPDNANDYCDCSDLEWWDSFSTGLDIDFCGDGVDQDCDGVDLSCNSNEIIMDNLDARTSNSGPWYGSTSYNGYYSPNYDWSTASNAWFSWNFDNLNPGLYEVYVSYTAVDGRPTDTSYDVSYSLGSDSIQVDQTSGWGWNLLGSYDASGDLSVTLDSGSGGGEGACADAVRLVRVQSYECVVDDDCDEGYTCAQHACEATAICIDVDGDGYGDGDGCLGPDCNDQEITVWQNVVVYWDRDGDWYGFEQRTSPACLGNLDESTITALHSLRLSLNADDCDDSLARVFPGAPEICGNQIDDDCNGKTDETCVLEGREFVRRSDKKNILQVIVDWLFSPSK